ncbi:hypothetical protein CPJ18_07235 [Agrobacterium rosae]|uniref:Uncharacterized protein n=1 Tax=Agrobacterium rosae TaxID=1972867 RepID=A0AAE5VQX2_9HYPH|nr:hypothetical protein DXM21_21755 [Agrobacterium rosae]KAA3516583.1 hypothetical protein DXM25_19960 [Agrobacterium rosae]MQB50391.1 hypothetical protein [Agrobacterium rosae]POO53016.1 hypothetical protein CPJ18_07235 [Agrobacterium rosae]
MNQFEYLVGLRRDLLGQIGLIKSSKYLFSWDDTISNYTTRRALIDILERYINAGADLGLLVVTRHSTCPNKRHPDYPTSNKYGYDIPYRSDEFIWEGNQLYQGKRICICPCSVRNAPSENWVIDDFVFKRDADLIFCRQLSSALIDVHCAIESSGDKKTRSGIREYLLRAILTLNDAILPQTVEEYISRRTRSDGTSQA